LSGAKVATFARVAVKIGKARLGLGTDSRNYPSSKDLDYRPSMSALWECFWTSGRNYT